MVRDQKREFLSPHRRSLTTGGNLFMLRYDLLRHRQFEMQTESESGVDLFYKMEFN